MMAAPPPPPIEYPTKSKHSGPLLKSKSAAAPNSGSLQSKGSTLPPAYPDLPFTKSGGSVSPRPATVTSPEPSTLIGNNPTGKGFEWESAKTTGKLSSSTSSMQPSASDPFSAPSYAPVSQQSRSLATASASAGPLPPPPPASGPFAGAGPGTMFGAFGPLLTNKAPNPVLESQEEYSSTPLVQEGYTPSKPAAPKVSILTLLKLLSMFYLLCL
jgi:hypothetical protein